MKVVVTGATGNVGTRLLDLLARDPAVSEVIGMARRPAETSWAKTTVVPLDLAADDLRSQLRGAEAVVHLAWLFQPSHRPTVTWAANVGGSIRLFEAAVAEGVRTLVYASSVGAYSPGADRTVAEDWPTESLPTAAYGREKAYVERVLDALEARHPEVRVVRMRPAFIFQAASGSQQRRLFAGPFVPSSLLRLARFPVVPLPRGLRFQALHTSDAARAYQLALASEVRGPFNLASEPVIDGAILAGLLGGRPFAVPPRLVKGGLTAAWHAHLVPAEPPLLDLALGLPLMRTDRARSELRWSPTVSADDAVAEALSGMGSGVGAATAPLAPDSMAGRAGEIVGGVGEKA